MGWFWGAPSLAHQLEFSTVRLRWVNERLLVGEVVVDASISAGDRVAGAAGDPQLDAVVDSVRARRLVDFLSRELVLLADDRAATLRFSPLIFGDPGGQGGEGTDVAEVHVKLAEPATKLVLRPSAGFGDTLFAVETDDSLSHSVLVRAGQASPEFRVEEASFPSSPSAEPSALATSPSSLSDGVASNSSPGVQFGSGQHGGGQSGSRESTARAGRSASGFSDSALSVFLRYLGLGTEHIVPKGFDHVLFVFGLCLVRIRPWRLLGQLTLFTLAHSMTLALAALDVWRLSPSIVEPLIGLSIALVALENLLSQRARSEPTRRRFEYSRGVIVFIFGLVHGLGFAGVLSEIGIPADSRVAALAGFNLGVEFGQLIVVAVAAVVLWRLWARPRESSPAEPVAFGRLTLIANGLIALAGVGLALKRAFA